MLLIGVFGAALFYGDGVITPAISVLSAVEGLEVGTAAFKPYVVPIAVVVIVALFAVAAPRHRRGRRAVRPGHARSGSSRSALLGVCSIAQHPAVLARAQSALRDALRSPATASRPSSCWARWCWPSPAPRRSTPTWAISASGRSASPGSAWCCPALVLNYFGQGALLIADPGGGRRTRSTCWRRTGRCIRWSALATAATVIASQAMISGAYLDDAAGDPARLPAAHERACTPRRSERGQIYIPAVNWLLLLVVLAAVIGFGSSTRPRRRPTASRSPAPC